MFLCLVVKTVLMQLQSIEGDCDTEACNLCRTVQILNNFWFLALSLCFLFIVQ